MYVSLIIFFPPLSIMYLGRNSHRDLVELNILLFYSCTHKQKKDDLFFLLYE